jgi:hypothetical protein
MLFRNMSTQNLLIIGHRLNDHDCPFAEHANLVYVEKNDLKTIRYSMIPPTNQHGSLYSK